MQTEVDILRQEVETLIGQMTMMKERSKLQREALLALWHRTKWHMSAEDRHLVSQVMDALETPDEWEVLM